MLVDDLDDPRLQALHPPDCELGSEHAAQPLVFWGVDPEQVSGAELCVLFSGDRGGIGPPAWWLAVREAFGIRQRRLDVAITGHQVGR